MLIKCGGFISDLELGADWFACFVCAFRHGVCYIPESLSLAMVRKESYSAQGLSDGLRQRNTFFKILTLLNSTHSEIKEYFKKSAVVYEYSWRALFWLFISPKYYSYISFRLIKRLIARGSWNYFRSRFSVDKRNKIRKLILKYKIST